MLAASSISIFVVASGALASALHSGYGSTGQPAEPVLLVQVRVSNKEDVMKIRKVTVGLALTALALTPGFLPAGPAAAQDQTKEKHANRKGQTMTLDQLPQPVQQTINQQSQGGKVSTIKQEARGGKTFYVAEITDQNGKKKHVRVNEDGSLMTGRSARRQDGNSKASPAASPNTTK
jgi:uncharacterized membrane protein YkoI